MNVSPNAEQNDLKQIVEDMAERLERYVDKRLGELEALLESSWRCGLSQSAESTGEDNHSENVPNRREGDSQSTLACTSANDSNAEKLIESTSQIWCPLQNPPSVFLCAAATRRGHSSNPARRTRSAITEPLTPSQPRERFAKPSTASNFRMSVRRLFNQTWSSKSIDEIIDAMIIEKGGTIVIICDPKLFKKAVRFSTLDGGALREVFQTFGQSMKDKPDVVLKLLRAFRSPSDTDKWTEEHVRNICKELELGGDGVPQQLSGLIGQPMDGAIVFSPHGTMIGASEHLQCPPAGEKLASQTGHMGTKHQSAFAAAVCIQEESWAFECEEPLNAAVLVSSDSGSLTAMLVDGKKGSEMEILQTLPENEAISGTAAKASTLGLTRSAAKTQANTTMPPRRPPRNASRAR